MNLKKERRVVNFNKKDFDEMKQYCDKHALDLPKWLIKLAFKEINKNIIKKENL